MGEIQSCHGLSHRYRQVFFDAMFSSGLYIIPLVDREGTCSVFAQPPLNPLSSLMQVQPFERFGVANILWTCSVYPLASVTPNRFP